MRKCWEGSPEEDRIQKEDEGGVEPQQNESQESRSLDQMRYSEVNKEVQQSIRKD